MPMPDLDPARYVAMRLSDLGHTLPIPGQRRLFSKEPDGERVDTHDPYWQLCIADGSLIPVAAAATDDFETAVFDTSDAAPADPASPPSAPAPSRPLAGLVAVEQALDALGG